MSTSDIAFSVPLWNRLESMKHLILFLLACSIALSSFATHNRAGEITFNQIGPLTYETTIQTYTKASSVAAARDSIEINWGDGIMEILSLAEVDSQFTYFDLLINKYTGTHTYDGAVPFVIVSMVDPTRVSDIVNIDNGNSVVTNFYLEGTIYHYSPLTMGLNHGPVFHQPPVIVANVGQAFSQSLFAFEPDGDSLAFQLIEIGVPNYLFPDEVMPGPGNSFSVDNQTGKVAWAAPQQPGLYNFAVNVREFRCGFILSTTLREVQILVVDEPNQVPGIQSVSDTIVQSGSTISLNFVVIDSNLSQLLTMEASGGPFLVNNNPATFVSQPGTGAITGSFSWTPNLSQVQTQPYLLTVTGHDDYVSPAGMYLPLTVVSCVSIKVVPHPDSLWADPCNSFLLPGVPELHSQNERPFNVFPNPLDRFLNITGADFSSEIHFTLFNSSGQKILKSTKKSWTKIFFAQTKKKNSFQTRKNTGTNANFTPI